MPLLVAGDFIILGPLRTRRPNENDNQRLKFKFVIGTEDPSTRFLSNEVENTKHEQKCFSWRRN